MATVAEVPETVETQALAPDTTRSDRAYRMTIEIFEKLARSGVFGSKSRIFLWKGRLVEPMGKGRPHTIALRNLFLLASQLIPEGWYAEQEGSMAIPDDGLPEPDFKVVRGKPEDYPRFHPSTREVAWIAEIAESSLAEDQGEVLQTYAEHEIPVYWIVNLPGRRIQVYTDPSGSSASPAYYRTLRTFVAGDEIPLILDGRDLGRIAVADILTV